MSLVVSQQPARSLVGWARDTSSTILQLAEGRPGNDTIPRATGDTADQSEHILQMVLSRYVHLEGGPLPQYADKACRI